LSFYKEIGGLEKTVLITPTHALLEEEKYTTQPNCLEWKKCGAKNKRY